MRRVVLAVLLIIGCKDKQEAARDVVDRTTEKTAELTAGAKDRLGQVSDRAIDTAGTAVATATGTLDRALAVGKRAKAELDKVYKSDHAYELAVDDVGSEEAAKHLARLDKMPAVEIEGVRVGYEEDSQLSLRGTTYTKHFRASWKRGDQIVRVSFYTVETIDVVAFAALLEKLVPAVEKVL